MGAFGVGNFGHLHQPIGPPHRFGNLSPVMSAVIDILVGIPGVLSQQPLDGMAMLALAEVLVVQQQPQFEARIANGETDLLLSAKRHRLREIGNMAWFDPVIGITDNPARIINADIILRDILDQPV